MRKPDDAAARLPTRPLLLAILCLGGLGCSDRLPVQARLSDGGVPHDRSLTYDSGTATDAALDKDLAPPADSRIVSDASDASGYSDPDSGYSDPDSGYSDPDSGYSDPDYGYSDPDYGSGDPDYGSGDPDACVPQPENCQNNADENCNGIVDDPPLCDVNRLIQIENSPAGGAWSPSDVGFTIVRATTQPITLECRTGRVGYYGDLTGSFGSCGPGSVTVSSAHLSAGDGLYRTEIRVRHGDGTRSRALALDYYVHRSLSGVSRCTLGAPDDTIFAAAAERLPSSNTENVGLTFTTKASRSTSGAAHLRNPFIRINFTPRVNRQFAFRLPGYPSWIQRDGVLEVLSLRRRFTLSNDRSRVLVARRYAARRPGNRGCKAMTVRVHAYGNDHVHSCDAVVLNREGAGVCLRVSASGAVTFARQPNTSYFGRLANALLSPPDEPLTNGVDNALWRKLAARHTPNQGSSYDRTLCRAGSCGDEGVGHRWGWQHFSPKCYGDPICVDKLLTLELSRPQTAPFVPLYLPDHRHFGL
jgi:hypothetical protein